MMALTMVRLPLQRLFKHLSSAQAYDKEAKCGKEKCMLNDNENRVLARRNAHHLSAEEFQKILEEGKTQRTQVPSIPFSPDF